MYQVQLRWSVSESITVIWHSRVSLPSWGDGKKGSSTFIYDCDTFTSDFNLTIPTIIWTKTSMSPTVWAYDRTGLKFEEYFQMVKIFLLPETDFLTDRSSYIQIPPPPLPKIPKDDFALLSIGGRSGITLFTQSRNKVNQTWILFSSTQTHFQHD